VLIKITIHATILSILLLSGCVSVSTTVRETQAFLNQWIGRSVTQLVEENGLPVTVIRMDNKKISHIKKESWDSSHGLFTEIDSSINARQWNNGITAWVLVYRYQDQRNDGNYYLCTQAYRINHRGTIIGVKEGWVSTDEQNPCYLRYRKQNNSIYTVDYDGGLFGYK